MKVSSVSGKKWILKNFDSSDVKKFSELYSLNETVAKLLSIRKKNIEDINLFLDPKIKNLLPNPLHLKDMKKAIDRTYVSISRKESIGIFGDYDVDGASSTAILSRYFLSIKQKIITYIPDRHREGYGPSKNGFEYLIRNGCKIIYTVDCGTSSFDPIKYAQLKKVDVIVLDHHQSGIKLPNACAVVNPNRYDDTSKLNYLCASGVCFVFLVALNKKLRDNEWLKKNKITEPNVLNLLDLVSLGTVCDVVPLVGLNRAIVKQGLKVIKKRSNLGLKTLYDLCNIQAKPTTFDLGFKLGPRINAGGRVGNASHGAELLISDDPQKTYKIALDLEKSNKERQSIESLLSEEINSKVKNFDNHPVLVLAGKNWHEGIIGIVAARIKDKFNKPTVLISINSNICKGSARSIIGFDIGAAIIKAAELEILIKGGGHKMAGGFSIKEDKIEIFRDFLIKIYEKNNKSNSNSVNMYLDTIIAPSCLNEKFYDEVNFLAPFGSGNIEPKFAIENIKVIKKYIVGTSHLKVILRGRDGSIFKGFVWNAKNTPLDEILDEKNKKLLHIAGRLRLNEWRGEKNVEFIIEDVSIN